MAISIELWTSGSLSGGLEEWWDPIEAALPASAKTRFPLLSRVDPYDEVHFTHDELEPLTLELAALSTVAPEGSQPLIDRLRDLCERGMTADVSELRFVGD